MSCQTSETCQTSPIYKTAPSNLSAPLVDLWNVLSRIIADPRYNNIDDPSAQKVKGAAIDLMESLKTK